MASGHNVYVCSHTSMIYIRSYVTLRVHLSIGYIAIPEEIAVFRTIHGLLPLPRVDHCQSVLKSMSRTNCTRQIIHHFRVDGELSTL